MNRIGLVGLMKIVFPDTTEVTLCDGGAIEWSGDTYTSKDATFGTIGAIEPLTEGVGDEVPALDLTMQPPDNVAAGLLSQPGFQTAEVTLSIAEYDEDTGLVVGTPDTMFVGLIDQTSVLTSRDKREVKMSIVSAAEKLFEGNTGNNLSPTFHKSIWPGELGHDNATGLAVSVAWGTTAPVTTSVGGGGGGGPSPWKVVNDPLNGGGFRGAYDL